MGTPSEGAFAKLAIDAALPFDTSSEPYEFISENLIARKTILDGSGIRGTRSHPKERCRAGTYTVGGPIVMQPTPEELDLLLPRILGGAESTDTFALAETLPEFQVMIDRVAKVFTYEGCKVNRATFRGQQGGLLQLTLDIEGQSESVGNAGSFPAITNGLTAPFVFMDGVLTLQSSARAFFEFELVIDNMLDTGRFLNATTRADLPEQDRMITLRVRTPYTSDETALYDQALAGAAGTLVFTNGNYSTTFTFANLKAPAQSPSVSGKTEIPLVLEMVAYMDSTTRELVVTHDETP